MCVSLYIGMIDYLQQCPELRATSPGSNISVLGAFSSEIDYIYTLVNFFTLGILDV